MLDTRIRSLESALALGQLTTGNGQPSSPSRMDSVFVEEQHAESAGVPSSPMDMWNPTGSISRRSSILSSSEEAFESFMCEKDIVEVLVNPQSKCSTACTCACHRKSSSRTPEYLDLVLGSMFTGYKGSPQGSRSCDAKTCLKQSLRTSVASVMYMFPRWWIWNLAISMRFAPEYQFRVLRVRSKSDPVFKALTALKLPSVRKMIQLGHASVLDVNEDGQSLLTVRYSAKACV